MTVLDWAILLLCLGVTLSGFWDRAVRLVFGGRGAIAGVWLALSVGGEAARGIQPVIGVHWLAAVLGPMLVLFGLKFGIVGGMLTSGEMQGGQRPDSSFESLRGNMLKIYRSSRKPPIATCSTMPNLPCIICLSISFPQGVRSSTDRTDFTAPTDIQSGPLLSC